jgi:hypothetical protein
LWCIRGRLLFGSLALCCGRTGRRRSVWVYSGLLLNLAVAVKLISELLVIALAVLRIGEHPDLLRRGKGRDWRDRSSRGSWGRFRNGAAGARFLTACAQQENY